MSRPLDPTPSRVPGPGCGSGCWSCRRLALIAVLVLCLPDAASEAVRHDARPTPGRRSAARQTRAAARRHPLLAVGLPCSPLVRGPARPPRRHPGGRRSHPSETALTRATVICPSAGRPASSWPATRTRPARRSSARGVRRSPRTLAPRPAHRGQCRRRRPAGRHHRGRSRARPAGGPLRRADRSLPSAGRRPSTSGSPASAPAPSTRRSLELVNPDPGPAVVDVHRLRPSRAGRRARAARRRGARPVASCGSTSSQEVPAPRRPGAARHDHPGPGLRLRPGHLRRARLRRLGHRLPAVAGRPGHQQPAARAARRHRPPDAAPGQPWRDRDPRQHQGRHRGRRLRRRGHRRRRDPAAERRPGVGRHRCCAGRTRPTRGLCSSSPAPR